jgi:ketosteroid isomerase-like protein
MTRSRGSRNTLVIAAAIAMTGLACAARAGGPETATASPAASRSDSLAILAAARAFSAAYVRGDADSMAALYTEDAAIFPEGTPAIVGRDSIRRYWTLPPNRRITRHVLLPERIELLGNIAHDHGRFEVAGETDGAPWGPSFGKYLVVWHRAADGQWRMHLDMWNRGPQPSR